MGETDSRPQTTAPDLELLEFPAMELYAMPAATATLLEDTAVNIDDWIAGDGDRKPTGFLHYTKVAEASWAWTKIGSIVTGVSGDFAASDPSSNLVDLVYALKAGYRQNASWVMNRSVQAAVRKLKDENGNYIWQPAAVAGGAASLMNFPIAESEDMPDIGANAYAIALGDFRRGYLIVTSIFGRTGAVAAAASDYDASQVDNDSSVSGATVKDALDALASSVTGKQAADGDLTALAGVSATGLLARTGSGTAAARTVAAPAAGITVSNGDGVSGNPTLALANDLAALEAMSGTGIVARTAAETYAQRTITAPAAGIGVSNGNGVSGNPTLALANDLAALEGLSSTGLAVRTGSDAWAQRSIAGTGGVAVSNGDGVSGNPSIALTDPTAFASINGGPIGGWRNLLINPHGRINQRAPASNADDTYGHDRWYALTQTGTIAVSTVTDAENGTPKMWRLTQSQASAQRMGYAQIVEGANCKHLRGKSVTLSGRFRFSLNAAVRYAILEWTGTEDAVTSDVVNSWTNGTFTAGQFFISSNLTVSAVGSLTPSAATLTDLTALTATLGSSFNNLIVFIWTEGTAAQNATLDGALQLEIGSVASQREIRPLGAEITLCNRYYERATYVASFYQQNGNVGGPFFTFTVTKRVAPTIVRLSGTPGGAQSGTPSVTGYEKVNGFRYSFTNNAEGVVFDDNADITADAEL